MSKLGTDKKPAIMRVRSEARAKEILGICQKHGWKAIVGIEPDKSEDTSDLEKLLNSPVQEIASNKTGRNEPCPCGSGKKYKKCCGG